MRCCPLLLRPRQAPGGGGEARVRPHSRRPEAQLRPCVPPPSHTPGGADPERPGRSRPALNSAASRSPRAAQQRVASRRHGQGPHWFNISFSFQSIVPI